MPDQPDANPRSVPTADGPSPDRTNTYASGDDHTDGEDPSHIDPTTFLAPKQKPDELGRLGPYRVLKLLGKGGMGFVFLAEDEMLERKVALKVMRPDVAMKLNAKERFLREGRAAAKVKHDNVISIYAVGEDRGMPFLALEYLEGMPLDQYLKSRGEIALDQAIRIARETAEGLQAAHQHGLIHRDIKPANIWLEAPRARVKVLDFGLARQEKENTHLTQSGAVVGTPAYMSPSRRGVNIDARSDLWSLGVMLYRLCTGRMPFEGETTLGVLTALALDQQPPPRQLNPKVPEALEAIIQRLLRKKPEERYQSAQELIAALDSCCRDAESSERSAQKIVYVPMAVPAETNPFEGIDDSDYTNPIAPVAKSRLSAPTREAATRSASAAERSAPKTPRRGFTVALLALVAIALAVGGYFAFRGGNKDEPKPDGTVKNNDPPPKVIKDNPPPKKIDSSLASISNGNEVSFDLGNGVKLEVVKINAKGKTFTMGSPKDEAGRIDEKDDFDREEQHEVTFGHDYFIGKYEITQEQYEAVMFANPSQTKGAKHPVEKVSWHDAEEFIKKLNNTFKDRKVKFRLPSEAEWEFACRAGTTSPYHFDKIPVKAHANVGLTKEDGSTKPVGSYQPNAFGLYDMHGNVREWCEDYFGPYSAAPKDGTAQLAKQVSPYSVCRGGSWYNTGSSCRSAVRMPSSRNIGGIGNGFRVAVDIADDSPLLPKKDPPPVTKGREVSFDLGNGVKLDVVKINAKGKTFLMGSPKDEVDRKDDEEQHEVTFGHDFHIGKFELTQEQYEAVMGNNPSVFRGKKNPVEKVSWNEAQEFCQKLNDKFQDRKLRFRLPSEAEWEYACRAGTNTAYSVGATITNAQARFSGLTRPIGSHDANAFGLYDMHGNVMEWCEDYYGPYSAAPKNGKVQNIKQSNALRVLRGGGAISPNSSACRSAIRYTSLPDNRGNTIGFRVVVDIADDSPLLPKKEPPVVKGPEVSFDLGNGVKLDVIKINAKGQLFMMGSPKDEEGREVGKSGFDPEEQHEVTFGRDYFMGKYEVTQEQYEAVMGTNPSQFVGSKNPVDRVSWNGAQLFIKKLNEKFTNRKVVFRLPSESEWEYACRAGTTTPYHYGKTISTQQANIENPKGRSTKSVGSYDPNAFGLYDMHGNVGERCEDYYGAYDKAPKDGTTQSTIQLSDLRVRRGGSWNSNAADCRSAKRGSSEPGDRSMSYIGFRVAVDIADDSPLLPKKEEPQLPPKKGESKTIDLFDGKTLNGWEGYGDLWSVKESVIVGKNQAPLKYSTYLLTKDKYSDFRLIFAAKLVESEMHSGVAFWGEVSPKADGKVQDAKSDRTEFTLAGHLVMFPSNYGLYDLFGRSSLGVDGGPAKKVGHQHDWNDIEILAQGNRVRVAMNGAAVVDWRDSEAERIKQGPIGLQLHANKVPQEVHFKGLKLETFPKEDRLITVR